MTRIITVFIALVSWMAHGQSDNLSLVGQWEGVEGGDSLTFIFEKDSVITMLNSNDKGTIIGGKESVRLGKKVRMIYQTDLSQKPYAIDFVIQEIETKKEQGRMTGIFEFVGEKRMKINFGPNKERPKSFEHFFIMLTKIQ